MGSTWGAQGGIVALGVVLGSSISLVGLAFAFITYRWVSIIILKRVKMVPDLRTAHYKKVHAIYIKCTLVIILCTP